MAQTVFHRLAQRRHLAGRMLTGGDQPLHLAQVEVQRHGHLLAGRALGLQPRDRDLAGGGLAHAVFAEQRVQRAFARRLGPGQDVVQRDGGRAIRGVGLGFCLGQRVEIHREAALA